MRPKTISSSIREKPLEKPLGKPLEKPLGKPLGKAPPRILRTLKALKIFRNP